LKKIIKIIKNKTKTQIMSHLLTSGQVGNIGMNHMKAIRLETQSKWDSLGFLEGLKGHVKETSLSCMKTKRRTLLRRLQIQLTLVHSKL
jgi:hypothetical protein